MKGAYSIAYLEIRRTEAPASHIVHGWAWAAWWTGEPCHGPWRTPDAFGIIEQEWGTEVWARGEGVVEIAADEAIRAALSQSDDEKLVWSCDPSPVGKRAPRVVETYRTHSSFARAALREHRGQPPRHQAPRPTKYKRANPIGAKRPPTQPARAFYEAHWREVDETLRRRQEARYAYQAGVHVGVDPAIARGDFTTSVRTTLALAQLGLSLGATKVAVVRAFRKRCLTEHPDRGGTAERFRKLIELRDRAMREISG